MEKGYNTVVLDKAIIEIHQVPQSSCLTDKVKQKDNKHEWGFISGYHAQYKEVETIFKK